MEARETFAEYQTTEWEGVKIRTSIHWPHRRSNTSQMVLDHRQMEAISDINMPDDLRLMMDAQPDRANTHMAYAEWQERHDKALRLVDHIAHEIARCLIVEAEKDNP